MFPTVDDFMFVSTFYQKKRFLVSNLHIRCLHSVDLLSLLAVIVDRREL
jgi:hypothetical protein